MGDDFFNPWTDETYVKRLSWWQTLLADALAIVVLVFTCWALAIFVLSLERV